MAAPPVASYELKRFVSASDPEFAAALQIYVRNTPPSTRTDTNEIAFWLERFTERFGDPFYAFGFYRNGTLVGYAEAAYFTVTRLIMLDYLVVDVGHRGHNVFFEFVDHLRSYLEQEHSEYRYAVAEVAYGPGRSAPSPNASLRVRLLRLQGFRVIPARYVQPRLLLDDTQGETSADLLIYSTEPIDSLRKEAYLGIIRTIYYQYYLPWKSILPSDAPPYRAYLDGLYEDIKRSLADQPAISIAKGIQPPSTSPAKPHHIVGFVAQALIVVVLTTTGLFGLQSIFHLANGTLIGVFSLSVATFLGIAGIVSANARLVFREVMVLARLALSRHQGPNASNNPPIQLNPSAGINDTSPTVLNVPPPDNSPISESASA